MKTKVLLTAILFVMLAGFFEQVNARPGNVYFGYFYENLRGHGRWLVLNDDLVVWKPYRVTGDWAPYQRGTWIWSDYGWYWSSYEPYGYIVYHYGRWHFDDYYGWIWVPDYEWAPAWVEWRYDNNYIGWAPLPPYATYRHGYGIYYSINFTISHIHFHFVSYKNFCAPNMYKYYVHSNYKYRIYNDTRRQDGSIYYDNGIRNRGVDRNFVERRSGRSFSQRDLAFNNNDERRPGGNERIRVEKVDFTRERTINAAELNLERGKVRSTLRTEKVEIGARETAMTGERERKPEVRKDAEVQKIQSGERTRTEVRTPPATKDERAVPIQKEIRLETRKDTETRTQIREENRSINTESRRTETQTPVRENRERSERVATPQRENRDTRGTTELRTRSGNTTPSPVVRQGGDSNNKDRKAVTRDTDRNNTGTKERERR